MADQRRGKHKPKGKRDREMKEDFNAMFDLLEEHGLLMGKFIDGTQTASASN